MKHSFGKMHDKTTKPPQQPTSPGKSSNVAAGLSGSPVDQDDGVSGRHNCRHMIDLPNLTAETDNRSTGASSRIAIQDEASEIRVSNPGIDGTGSGQEFASGYFSPLRLKLIPTQASGSPQNRRDRRYWSWGERLSGTIERYVSM